MNVMTIVVIVVLAGCTLAGRKAGLIKTVFSMFSVIAALLLAAWLSPAVGDFMKKNEDIAGYFEEKVGNVLGLENKAVGSDAQDSFIEDLPLPGSLKQFLLNNNETGVYRSLGVNSFITYINKAVTNVVINAAAFIGTFLVVLIALRIVCFVLDIISKLPVLNSVNKAGGMIAGLLHGLMIVWVVFIFITAAGSTTWGQDALSSIDESSILTFLYDHNLITNYITKLRF